MAKQKREVRHCQRCGEMNKPTDDECVSCGRDITDDPQFMFGGAGNGG